MPSVWLFSGGEVVFWLTLTFVCGVGLGAGACAYLLRGEYV